MRLVIALPAAKGPDRHLTSVGHGAASVQGYCGAGGPPDSARICASSSATLCSAAWRARLPCLADCLCHLQGCFRRPAVGLRFGVRGQVLPRHRIEEAQPPARSRTRRAPAPRCAPPDAIARQHFRLRQPLVLAPRRRNPCTTGSRYKPAGSYCQYSRTPNPKFQSVDKLTRCFSGMN